VTNGDLARESMGEMELAASIENSLTSIYGPMLTGSDLVKVLAFPSAAAFRKAKSRNTLPISVYSLPNRKGTFALTKDVANWLANSKYNSTLEDENM